MSSPIQSARSFAPLPSRTISFPARKINVLGPKRRRFRGPEARFEHDPNVEVVPVGPEVALVRLIQQPIRLGVGEDPRELTGASHGSTDLAGNELKVGLRASTGRKPANRRSSLSPSEFRFRGSNTKEHAKTVVRPAKTPCFGAVSVLGFALQGEGESEISPPES